MFSVKETARWLVFKSEFIALGHLFGPHCDCKSDAAGLLSKNVLTTIED